MTDRQRLLVSVIAFVLNIPAAMLLFLADLPYIAIAVLVTGSVIIAYNALKVWGIL